MDTKMNMEEEEEDEELRMDSTGVPAYARASDPAPKRHQEASAGESESTRPSKTPRDGNRTVFGIGLDIEETHDKIIESGVAQIDDATRAENAKKVAAAERARAEISQQALTAFGINPDPTILAQQSDDDDYVPPPTGEAWKKFHNLRLDFFASLGSAPELLIEIAKWLSPASLLRMVSISKDFYHAINDNLASSMKTCAKNQAPESTKIYIFKLYAHLCVPDPGATPHPTIPGEVRLVPSLRWLQMVVHRDRCVRDILALMARSGHRMPKGMGLSLKKMWLLMDISFTAGRVQFTHGKWIRDIDLYHWQFFIVKLDMRFNDPVHGPGDDSMRKLFLGQRGLTPLRSLLKRTGYLQVIDVVKEKIRYQYNPKPWHLHLPIFGISPEEVGIGHLEGWGKGGGHLMRPDELVVTESVRRKLRLKYHIMEMMLWGYIDMYTGLNISPSEDEKYMSDDEETPVRPYWRVDGNKHPAKEDNDIAMENA